MERKSTGMKYMTANCDGSQSPPRAVELRKKKNKSMGLDLPAQCLTTILDF
jgi:hypothetical protein